MKGSQATFATIVGFRVFSLRVSSLRWCLLGVLLAAGCETVDTGPFTGPPAGCDAPAPYFVSDVWPRYFERYMCAKGGCHDASSGHGFFRLQSVAGVAAPQPTDPVSIWPAEWAANLRTAQQNISCSNPTASLILTVPEGRGQPHPPGAVVTDMAEAETIFRTWLK
jgi:hypothetical protein